VVWLHRRGLIEAVCREGFCPTQLFPLVTFFHCYLVLQLGINGFDGIVVIEVDNSFFSCAHRGDHMTWRLVI
jgi:hypothetical protein